MNSTPFDKPHGIDLEHGRHFGGQVVTNCEGGGLQEVTNKSLPRVGIMTKTEFHRDVSNATYTDETYGASSSYDKIRAETKNDRAKDLPLRPE